METWAPLFAVAFHIPKVSLLDLFVPEMVDHVDYAAEVNRGGSDG